MTTTAKVASFLFWYFPFLLGLSMLLIWGHAVYVESMRVYYDGGAEIPNAQTDLALAMFGVFIMTVIEGLWAGLWLRRTKDDD